MRLLIFISFLFFSLSCTSTKKMTTPANILNGVWIPIKQEMAGRELSAASYKSQKLILADSNYTLMAESVDKGIARYKDGKMDIYGKDGVNAGKHITAIFTYEKELLTICYNLKGDVYPESLETKGKPMYFLSVFKKEMKK